MKLLLVNGPNLNLLGEREPDLYGSLSLEQLEEGCRKLALGLDSEAELETFQSNHEGEIIDQIQLTREDGTEGLLINPAGYGHTSVAIRDALAAVKIPKVEVHMTNIAAREPFRHVSLVSGVVDGTVTGFGLKSYELGLIALIDLIRRRRNTQNG